MCALFGILLLNFPTTTQVVQLHQQHQGTAEALKASADRCADAGGVGFTVNPTNVFLRRCGRAHGVSRQQAITLFILENLENRGLCLHSCRSVNISI
jgi:hypothetical protein